MTDNAFAANAWPRPPKRLGSRAWAVKVSDDMFDDLEALADRLGMSKAGLAREALTAFLDAHADD